MLRRNPPCFVPISRGRSCCRTNRLQEARKPLPPVLRHGGGRGWAHAQLKASRSAENSSIRDVWTHVRCRGHRVAGMRSDPSPVGVAHRLRLGDRGTLFEEGFGSASGEYEGSWQMQETEHTWGRRGPRIKNTLWHSRVSQCRRSNMLLAHLVCIIYMCW